MAAECTCSGDPRYFDPDCPVHGHEAAIGRNPVTVFTDDASAYIVQGIREAVDIVNMALPSDTRPSDFRMIAFEKVVERAVDKAISRSREPRG